MGEIVSATRPSDGYFGNRWSYTVRVFLPTETLLSNVFISEAFSSPVSHFQMKPMVSGGIDSSGTKGIGNAEDSYTRGSRCLVAFIGGEETNPVIIGMAPHPYSTQTMPDFMASPSRIHQEIDEELTGKEVYPALDLLFNGVSVKINETGEIFLRKTGALFVDETLGVTDPNPAGEVSVSILDSGTFSVSNSAYQSLVLSPSASYVQLSAAGSYIKLYKPEGEDSYDILLYASGDLESHIYGDIALSIGKNFLLNAIEKIDIYTDGTFNLEVKKTFGLKVTETATVEIGKDFLFKTIGKSTINLEDDVTLGAKKKLTATVGDALTLSVNKAFKTTVKDEYSVKSDKSMKMEGKDFLASDGSGAKLVLKGGKAALGNDQAELFQTLYTVFDKILKGGAQFAVGAQGPAVIGPDVSTAIAEFLMSIQKVMGSL
jgi:hypothetical protein